ncbi:MAG: DUF4276 family protein [Truepera sp.]|nr:DUF4276 family protein [Truepera sp.]
MTRLLVHVEGEAEESFVNGVLAPHLYGRGFSSVSARLIGNARQRDRRGGIRAWSTVRKDIMNHLKEDRASIATTMVDYYGLPQTGPKAWPRRSEAPKLALSERANRVETALLEDISREMGSSFNPERFIPYVVMHEFEALLFSDCDRFGRGIGRPVLAPKFQEIRDTFANPEEIDDSPETAPSKRVAALVPGYQKPLMGTLAVLEIGLNAIRSACPHFQCWLRRLERLPVRMSA